MFGDGSADGRDAPPRRSLYAGPSQRAWNRSRSLAVLCGLTSRAAADDAKGYVPRHPEQTVLYGLVRDHFDAFLDHARESYARGLPHYVEQAPASRSIDRLVGGLLLATSPRVAWATRIRRTHRCDVLACGGCGGRLRVLNAITEPAIARKILDHLGWRALPPRPRRHRLHLHMRRPCLRWAARPS